MTMVDELAGALRDLLDKVTDIRGVDIEEFYAPDEVKNAKKVLAKLEENLNE